MQAEELSLYYQPVAGLDVVKQGKGSALFRTDVLSVRLEGSSIELFVEEIFPLLNGEHTFADLVAHFPQIAAEDLRNHLEQLTNSGILRRATNPLLSNSYHYPFHAMYETLGLEASTVMKQLRDVKVGIIGLEGHGAHAATHLAQAGIGTLLLYDPFPLNLTDLALSPILPADQVGQPRQKVLYNQLSANFSDIHLVMASDTTLTKASLAAIVSGCNLLLCCFDRGFSAVYYWLNEISMEQQIPVIYSQVHGHTGRAGPFVLPGTSACYMCYRMRHIACVENFNDVMSYEESLSVRKEPALHQRAILPAIPAYLASVLVLESLKYLAGITAPSLASSILEFNALTLSSTTHSVLQKPDCPVCQVKKKSRHNPDLPKLIADIDIPGDIATALPRLVSSETGIIKQVARVPKDISEPPLPYVYRAEIANHQFLEDGNKREATCSGKGITAQNALISCVGEAVERYSGACWDYEEIVYAQRSELEGATLDPHQLVLYPSEQYQNLPYAPYRENSRLGWVQARSLLSNDCIWVPALAIFMNYEIQAREEYICPITSNGLATGKTLLNAIVSACSEVVERDAFIIAWLNRLVCNNIDPLTHPDRNIVDLCQMYKRRGTDIYLFRLPSDTPNYVFMALGIQRKGIDAPAAVVGLGSDMVATVAARQAILEFGQVRPALRRRMRLPDVRARIEQLIENPNLVADLEDHDLLYTSPQMLHAFDFLIEQPLQKFQWMEQTEITALQKLMAMLDYLHQKGGDLLYYNLTPPDMEQLNLYTARVILPDFQPIYFGQGEKRVGGKRLYALAQQLGLRADLSSIDQLNPDPHPLA